MHTPSSDITIHINGHEITAYCVRDEADLLKQQTKKGGVIRFKPLPLASDLYIAIFYF